LHLYARVDKIVTSNGQNRVLTNEASHEEDSNVIPMLAAVLLLSALPAFSGSGPYGSYGRTRGEHFCKR